MSPLSMEDLDSLLTFEQAMKRLNVSRTTLKTLIRNGEIGVVRLGVGRSQPRIPERALIDFINRRYAKPITPPAQQRKSS